jgi:hypothetical protein
MVYKNSQLTYKCKISVATPFVTRNLSCNQPCNSENLNLNHTGTWKKFSAPSSIDKKTQLQLQLQVENISCNRTCN